MIWAGGIAIVVLLLVVWWRRMNQRAGEILEHHAGRLSLVTGLPARTIITDMRSGQWTPGQWAAAHGVDPAVFGDHQIEDQPIHVASVIVAGERRPFARFMIYGGQARCFPLLPPSQPGDPRALMERMMMEEAWINYAESYGVDPRRWDAGGNPSLAEAIEWVPPLPRAPLA